MRTIDVGNQILDYIKSKDGWVQTSRVLSGIGLTREWHQKVRGLLKRLQLCGILDKKGMGSFRWSLTTQEWDRNNPFKQIGAPRDWKEPSPYEKVQKEPDEEDQKEEDNKSFLDQSEGEALKAKVAELETRLEELASDETVQDRVTIAVEQTTRELLKKGVIQQEIVVKVGNEKPVKIKGKVHQAFVRCYRLAKARKNILMVGPAGCGKSHLARQVAKALKLDFGHVSCSSGMSEGQLTGRLLPTGKGGSFEYFLSQFVKFYEEGGVFLFDELDAADSNVLLVVNSALANGEMGVPNRIENPYAKKHKDFVAIGAANTFGTGADRMYVGRNQLDESTLDRFRIGQVEMDYDLGVEEELCPDEELRTKLQSYREKTRQSKIRRIISSRFLRDAFIMKKAGDTEQEIETALFAGWSRDELNKVGHGSAVHGPSSDKWLNPKED